MECAQNTKSEQFLLISGLTGSGKVFHSRLAGVGSKFGFCYVVRVRVRVKVKVRVVRVRVRVVLSLIDRLCDVCGIVVRLVWSV